MTRVPFSFTRARLIGQNTLLEASRQKLFSFLLLLAQSALALGLFGRMRAESIG
jgi:hypothetical protein